jgi:predicted Fe-Mo cluster-binding NifX family protein
MKIAFTGTGDNWEAEIDPRFGRTDFILIYDEETQQLNSYDNRDVMTVAHGAGPRTSQKLYELAPDVLITGNGPGGNALSILSRMQLTIFTGAGGLTIRDAYEKYKNNQLNRGG